MRIDTPFAASFTPTSIDFSGLLIAGNTPWDTLESLRARKAAGETGLDAAISKASRECNAYNAGDDLLPRRGGRFVDPDGTTPKGGSEPAEPPVKPVKPVRETGSKKATAPGALDF